MCLPATPAHNQQHINNIAEHRIDQPPLIFEDGRRSPTIFTAAYTDVAPDEHNQQWVSSSEWAWAWLFSYFVAMTTKTTTTAQ